ncbi:hypothetical protein C8N25_11643 [Algoriphagus antarcticus]|uniref:Uncharacterized protein n=2 Tax=Algoriphagus antarcticus TaxID=238540 RepID=A0A3E0DQ57_9BACT|nr:hypothetical protein C8N25_11643 [Algoriphagus antarcticus]
MYDADNQYIFDPNNSISMTKLIPIFINGGKWIQLSQLSNEQSIKLKSWLPVSCLKKIMFQGSEFSECLDFETYEYWFRTHQISGQKQALLDF